MTTRPEPAEPDTLVADAPDGPRLAPPEPAGLLEHAVLWQLGRAYGEAMLVADGEASDEQVAPHIVLVGIRLLAVANTLAVPGDKFIVGHAFDVPALAEAIAYLDKVRSAAVFALDSSRRELAFGREAMRTIAGRIEGHAYPLVFALFNPSSAAEPGETIAPRSVH